MTDESFMPKLVRCKTWLLFQRKTGNIYCIGSDETGNFVEVPECDLPVIEEVIKYFDGKHSIRSIHEHIAQTMDLDAPIDRIFEIFRRANLIENSPFLNPDEFQIASFTLVKKNFGDFFKNHSKLSEGIFYSIFSFSMLSIILGLSLLGINYNGFVRFSSTYYMMGQSIALGIMVSFVIVYISSFVHELGHLIVGWYFGVPPKEARIVLYLGVFPMVFLSIPNIYTISYQKRIIIALAGIYTNLVIASVAIILLFTLDPILLVRQLLTNIALLNFVTPLFILNPFFPGDGYFLAVNILKTPNIRRRGFEKLRKISRSNWSKQEITFIVYAMISILIITYSLYLFAIWLWSAIIETLFTLNMLYTLIDYLLLGLKMMFFALMFYSIIRAVISILGRNKASM